MYKIVEVHKIKLVLIFLMYFSFSNAQKYTQSMPFDSTLYAGTYTVNSGCTSSFQLKVQLSSGLFSYVGGMDFLVIIDSVSFPGPISLSPVKPGDTTVLNSANSTFSTPAVSGLKFWYRIELAGTPTTVSQIYPCKIEISQCTCLCTDITIMPSTTNTTMCSVYGANVVNELNSSKNLIVFPNPANDILFIKGMGDKTDLSIYNVYGQLVLAKQTGNTSNFNIGDLSPGIYWLLLANENREVVKIKLAIEK